MSGEAGAREGRESPVVARVEGTPITVAELPPATADGQGANLRARLEPVLVRKLAAAEARRRGLANAPELRRELAAIRREATTLEEAALRDALFEEIRAGLKLEAAALREHYERTHGRYLRRELRLRVWRFASREAAERAAEALAAGEALAAPKPESYGPAPARALPYELARAALEIGSVGQRALAETSSGTALVELAADERAVAPFEAVRERVEASLRTLRAQEAWQELLKALRADAALEIDEDALDARAENAHGERARVREQAGSGSRASQ